MIASDTVVWRSGVHLGAAVRAARERMGMTQVELARRAGVGLKFLYELESGKDTLRADKVLDVLEVLGLELVVTHRGAARTAARAAVLQAREPRARYGTGAAGNGPDADITRMAAGPPCTNRASAWAAEGPGRAVHTGAPCPRKRTPLSATPTSGPP